jgi:hypothetical protein
MKGARWPLTLLHVTLASQASRPPTFSRQVTGMPHAVVATVHQPKKPNPCQLDNTNQSAKSGLLQNMDPPNSTHKPIQRPERSQKPGSQHCKNY